MLPASNLICQSVHVTDELQIGLEYDRRQGFLNIFVRNTDQRNQCPLQINVLSNDNNDYLLRSSEIQSGDAETAITDLSYRDEDEPKICIELSTIYVYDVFDETENELGQTVITSPSLLLPSPSPSSSSSLSSSSSSSCFDEPTTDNDDGYSTHSLDDTEQQESLALSIPSSKLIIPFVPYQHHSYPEEHVWSIRRLLEQVMWLSPFRRTVTQMMLNRAFH